MSRGAAVVASIVLLAVSSQPASADAPRVLVLRGTEPTALCRAVNGELGSLGMEPRTGAFEEAWPELVEGALRRQEVSAVVVCTPEQGHVDVFYRDDDDEVVSERIAAEATIHGWAVAVAERLRAHLLPPVPGEELPVVVEPPPEPEPPAPDPEPPPAPPLPASSQQPPTELAEPQPGVPDTIDPPASSATAATEWSDDPIERPATTDGEGGFPSRWWVAAGGELTLGSAELHPTASVHGRFGFDVDVLELGLGFAYQVAGPTVDTVDVGFDATALRIELRAGYRFDLSDAFAIVLDASVWLVRLYVDLFRVSLPLYDEGADEDWAFALAGGAEARFRIGETFALFLHASAAAVLPRIEVQLPARDFAPPLAELGHFVATLDAGARLHFGR